MARHVITWSDFSGGFVHAPKGWPPQAGHNSWTGENVQVFEDGTLGPRNPVRKAATTGVPNGHLWGLGRGTQFNWPSVWTDPDMRRYHYFIVGKEVFSADLNRTTPQAALKIGELDVEPDFITQGVMFDDRPYVTVRGDGTYKIDVVANTVEKLTGAPGGTAIMELNGRIYVGGDPSYPNRLYWCEVNDPTTWNPTDWIAIGARHAILGLTALRETILITRYDGALFALTGVEPEEFVLRHVGEAGLVWGYQATVFDGRLWIVEGGRPRVVTGADTKRVPFLPALPRKRLAPDHIAFAQWYGNWAISPTGDVLTVGNYDQALVLQRNAWSYHTFGESIADLCVYEETASSSDRILMGTRGDANTSPEFHTWQPGTNSNAPSPWEAFENCWVKFSPVFAPQGRDLSVEEVVLEYHGRPSEDASAEIEVRCTRLEEPVTLSFTVAADRTTAQHSRRIVRFPVRTGPAQTVQVTVKNIENMTIERVSVLVDSASAPLRGA